MTIMNTRTLKLKKFMLELMYVLYEYQLNFYQARNLESKFKTQNTENTLFPDSLVGTDSHTTMINGLGVLGWGVGGIEAEAVMLAQPISMVLPEVIGYKISGEIDQLATSTDVVLTITKVCISV